MMLKAQSVKDDEWPSLSSRQHHQTKKGSLEIIHFEKEWTISEIPATGLSLDAVVDEDDSLASSSSATSSTTPQLNFRHALLESTTTTPSPVSPLQENVQRNTTRKKSRSPRFVVVPVCGSKDVDDLQQQQQPPEGDDLCTIYYNTKSMGSSAYTTGKKLRPDEAKRRHFILQKKQKQRRS